MSGKGAKGLITGKTPAAGGGGGGKGKDKDKDKDKDSKKAPVSRSSRAGLQVSPPFSLYIYFSLIAEGLILNGSSEKYV